MPYISEDKRSELDESIDNVISKIKSLKPDELSGNLNYLITRILMGSMDGEIRYSKLNNIIGVIECVKLELYRRCSFYEDKKILENGDVKEYENICLSNSVKAVKAVKAVKSVKNKDNKEYQDM